MFENNVIWLQYKITAACYIYLSLLICSHIFTITTVKFALFCPFHHLKKGSSGKWMQIFPRLMFVVLHSCWYVCKFRCFVLLISTWILLNQTFYSKFSSKFWFDTLMLWYSTVVSSDTKHQEMLIILHICSFLMTYDSGYMCLGNSDTCKSNQIMYCDFFG